MLKILYFKLYSKSSLKSQGCLGVSEAEFAAWLMQEPPLLMWITTLNRIKSAEQSMFF